MGAGVGCELQCCFPFGCRLRALSDGSLSTGPTPAPSSKFKLADYRYGREEMLALYQDSYEPAAYLQEFRHIFVEETQTPICLLPLSEDEQVSSLIEVFNVGV